MDIGCRIAELRKENGLTQQELADKLFVSRSLVCKWESGKRQPDYRSVEQIAGVLGIDPGRIVSTEELLLEELSDCVAAGSRTEDKAALTAGMNEFLYSLPAAACDIFVQRYRLRRTPGEIGEMYGLAENHVRTILSLTRKKLKKFLGGMANG